ncbi:MAG: hypothetical protein AAF840_05990 [Bacteroidota bacterium]
MKNVFGVILLGLISLLIASCGQETFYTVPSIDDQFISFTIDGQPMTLSSISRDGYEPSSLQIGESGSYLQISRNSSDLTTEFTITSRALPLEQKPAGVEIMCAEFVPATRRVRTEEMTGSLYCPHTSPESGIITYEGLVVVDQVTGDNRVVGRFKTDPEAAGNAVTIENGKFDLVIRIN